MRLLSVPMEGMTTGVNQREQALTRAGMTMMRGAVVSEVVTITVAVVVGTCITRTGGAGVARTDMTGVGMIETNTGGWA